MARHREFDCEQALEAAMLLFWEKGYEGTSYADLSEATGVARPGLYSAFGDKQSLFLKALDRYLHKEVCFLPDVLNEPTAFKVIESALRQSARSNLQRDKPHGCLGINGALACSDESVFIRDTLNKFRESAVTAYKERFERAKREGDLPDRTDPETLARLIVTIMQGVAVQAKAGTSKQKIDQMLDMTLTMLRQQAGAAF